MDIYNLLDELKTNIKKKDNQIVELYKTISEQEKEIKNLSSRIDPKIKIDKETFIKSMNAIKAAEDLLHNLYTLDIYISENEVLCNLISSYIDLISISVNDSLNQKDFYSDLSYFIYDLDWGKTWKPGMVTENGKDIDMSSIEKMWEYFNRPKDKEDDT